jgi:hypothetical protein
MVSLSQVVTVVLYLLIAGAVLGLLKLLIDRAPFLPEGWKPIANYILLVLAVLVLIGILLSLVNGTPLIRMNDRAPVFQKNIVERPLGLSADKTWFIATY